MKLKNIYYFLLFFQLLLCSNIINNLYSQEKDSAKFQIDGNIRYRFEKWYGLNALNYGDDSQSGIGKINDNILLQRIILGINYKPKENIEINIHIQDSRAYGWSLRNSEEPDAFKIKKKGSTNPYYIMNPNEVFWEFYDFNIYIKDILKNFSLKIGRQKINLSDSRIFGPGEWGNSGRWTWDAFRFIYLKENLSFDAFIGGTRVNYPYRTTLPFTFDEYFGLGFYASFRYNKNLTIEPYFARKQEGNADYIKDQQIRRNWLGLRVENNNFFNFITEINYVREFGNENNKDISAYGLFTKIGYIFNFTNLKAIFSLRFTYASGGNKDDEIIRTFDPVFGASDKYYGWMNIVKWSNLDDREIVLEIYKEKILMIEIKYNQYRIPSTEGIIINGTLKLKPDENYLGEEFNLFTKYSLNDNWGFVFLLGVFNPKEVLEINGKNPKSSLLISFQILYNFKLHIL